MVIISGAYYNFQIVALSIVSGKDLSLMMQALNSLQTPEEKIAALCKKYADLLDQQKLLQKQIRIGQRKQVCSC